MSVADELERLARRVAVDAAEGIIQRRRRSFAIDTKSTATDLVTEIDTWAEEFIVTELFRTRPDDGFLGEEGASRPSGSGITWVIDPIDGTTNFVYDYPSYAVSIAAVDAEGAVVGVIAELPSGDVYQAQRGCGAHRNGTPISVSRCTGLDRSLVATGFSYAPATRTRQAEVVCRLIDQVRDIRRSGSAGSDLCSTAIGRVDVYYEFGLNRWDIAAGELIVREAGGVVRIDALPDDKYGVVAASPDVFEPFEAALEMARATPDGPEWTNG